MIRLTLTDPSNQEKFLAFNEPVVNIGRSPDNHVCLNDLRVSKKHGRVRLTEDGCVYEDLQSTNGSTILHQGQKITLSGSQANGHLVVTGDVVQIANYSLKLDLDEPHLKSADDEDKLTVVISQPTNDLAKIQADLFGADSRAADLILRLVRETGAAVRDQAALLATISDFVFEAFPMATHQALVVRDLDDGRLTPILAKSRDGQDAEAGLSRSIVNMVMSEEICLLFSQVQARMSGIESIMQSQIEAAICAPLRSMNRTFGAIQVDIRPLGKGTFNKHDVDFMAVLASYVSLVLENRRLYQQQRRAMESTINALVHSLSLKDSDTAGHSERVQAVSLILGEEIDLSAEDLEILSFAAILHDMGKHAVRNDVLFKASRLTSEEHEEISKHANHTQSILDKIYYPEHLRSIPLIAAYHHEKIDGSGTYGIAGDQIPIGSRIISVADAFDALASKRPYKEPMPLPAILATLNKDRNEQWDGKVIDALESVTPRIIREVYGADSFLARTSGIPEFSGQEGTQAA